jgi:hypothetical protein
MSLAKIPVSMLTAGMLALTVACSGASAVPPEAASVSLASAPAVPLAPAPAPNAGVAETVPAAAVGEPPLRKSPIQALNQMVTAQALLVSLLLVPLSKEAVEQPLARVDATRATPAP